MVFERFLTARTAQKLPSSSSGALRAEEFADVVASSSRFAEVTAFEAELDAELDAAAGSA